MKALLRWRSAVNTLADPSYPRRIGFASWYTPGLLPLFRTHFCGNLPRSVPDSALALFTAPALRLRTHFCGVPVSAMRPTGWSLGACVPVSASAPTCYNAPPVPDSALPSGLFAAIRKRSSIIHGTNNKSQRSHTLRIRDFSAVPTAYLFLRISSACAHCFHLSSHPGQPSAYPFLRTRRVTAWRVARTRFCDGIRPDGIEEEIPHCSSGRTCSAGEK